MARGSTYPTYFLQALPVDPGTDLQASPELGASIESVLETARHAWPDVALPPERFLAYLAERVPLEGAPHEGLALLHHEDLYLACACQEGNEAAIVGFTAAHEETISTALASMKNVLSIEEEVRQRLYEKLFTGTDTRRPKISSYFGRGPLRAWIRAATVREAISLLRRHKREVLGNDDYITSLADLGDDPEMLHLKGLYRSVFQVAFAAAFKQLSSKDRTLLRYKYSDAASLEEIARIYGVHRATAARWLAQIRENLLIETRGAMAAELKATESELDSIFRVIQSKLDVSLAGQLEASDQSHR